MSENIVLNIFPGREASVADEEEAGVAKQETLSKTYKLLSSSFLYRTTYISREVLTTTGSKSIILKREKNIQKV